MIEQIASFLFGAIFGSFLNVCVYRLPKDLSIIKPPSSCPKCNTLIKWYDNVPILSFIALRAKCRNCHDKISFRYPLVELMTALVFLTLYTKFGLSILFFKFTFLFCLLIVVSFIDIDYHAIPVSLTVIGIIVGLFLSLWESIQMLKSNFVSIDYLPIIFSIKGLIVGFGFSYMFKYFGDVFITLYLSFRNKESIEGETESLGLGDVDFLGMVGVFLGWQASILIFFIAPFFACIYAIFAYIFKKSHLIPYLPYLSLATVVVFFRGAQIMRLIIR